MSHAQDDYDHLRESSDLIVVDLATLETRFAQAIDGRRCPCTKCYKDCGIRIRHLDQVTCYACQADVHRERIR